MNTLTNCKRKPAASTQNASQRFFQNKGKGSARDFFFSPSTKTISASIQTKQSVGKANDQFEQEADRVADQVVSQGSAPHIQRKCEQCAAEEKQDDEWRRQPLEEEEEIQAKRGDAIQRQEMEDIEEEEEAIRTKREQRSSGRAESTLETQRPITATLASSQQAGHTLPTFLGHEMNSAFGMNFNHVRIHTGTPAVQMNRQLGAQAFTHRNNIYFNEGKFAPASTPGKRLLAHELAHVVQQQSMGRAGGAYEMIQRDLAIEALGLRPERALSQTDIRNAIRFNNRMFSDPYSLKTIRDVIGVPQYPAVSDRMLALGVARWQADHGIAQDGKVGVVTLMFILEELQAEGETEDVTLLRADFRGRIGPRTRYLPDLNTTHCGCLGLINDEIRDSLYFIPLYRQCSADPTITDGDEVEVCVDRLAGPTDTVGTAAPSADACRIGIERQPGHCGPLLEQVTRAHEQVHCVHFRELRQRHGRGRAFERAYNDAQDWVADEVNARRTDIATAGWMLRVLNRICAAGGGIP